MSVFGHPIRAALLAGLVALNVFAADTFTPCKPGHVPQTVTDLWKDYDPRAEPLDVTVVKEWKEPGVVTRYITFTVGTFKGSQARIAAYYTFPDNGQKNPAFVWSHGGGQRAERSRGVYFAKQGFATVDINWLGREMEPGISENTDWGKVDPTQGPRFYAKALRKGWKRNMQPDDYTLDPVVSPRNNNWFLLVVAAKRAITFLEQQPEVQPDQVGFSGFSMGGTITSMVAMDSRLKAVAPFVGGTANLHIDFPGIPRSSIKPHFRDLALYARTVDPGAYWPLVQCPVMFLSSSNDFHAAFERMYQSTAMLSHAAWRVSANMHENHAPSAEQWILLTKWFKLHLARQGQFIPQTPQSRLVVKGDRATFSVTPERRDDRLLETEVYYSYDPNATVRFWHRADAKQSGKRWIAELDVHEKLPLYVFALCRYALPKPEESLNGMTSTLTINSVVESHVPQELDVNALASLAKQDVVEDFKHGLQDWSSRDGRTIKTYKFRSPFLDLSAGRKLCVTIDPQGREMKVRLSVESRFLGGGRDLGSFHYATEVRGDGVQAVLIDAADFKGKSGKALAWDRITRFGITLVDGKTKEPVVLDSDDGRAILKQIKMVDASDRKARFVENLAAGKKQTVVAFGTSLTAVGAWVDQLRVVLDQHYPGLARVVNGAQGGANSDWGREALDEKVLKHNPDVVFMEFSVNDAVASRKTSVAHARGNLETMIDRILEHTPGCEIILQVMNPPVGTTKTRRPNLAAYNQMYRDVAEERGLQLIDHYPAWERLLKDDPAKFVLFMPDTIHPLRDGALEVITPVLLKELGLPPGRPEQSLAAPCLKYLTKCLIDKNRDSLITPEECDTYWETIFHKTDQNQDGALQAQELGPESLFNRMDTDQDGTVSAKEYLALYAPVFAVMRPAPETLARDLRFAARGENAPSEGAANAFDGKVATKWLDFSPEGSWIQCKYDTGTVVTEYAITSANDGSERDPKDWQLLGSNDGSNWTTLDSRSGEQWETRLKTRSFAIKNKAAYRFYRLKITAVRDSKAANSVQIAEIAFSRLEESRFEEKMHKTLPYRIYNPAPDDAQKQYPLILFLHGAGERGSDNAKQLVNGVKDILAHSDALNEPAIVLAPQCPEGKRWVETHWGDDSHTMPETPSEPMALAIELLQQSMTTLPVDRSRVYVTGLSMGGFGTWDIIQRLPGVFAAAIPVCGGGDTEQVNRLTGLPIWAFHGDQDSVVKPKRSRDMIRALRDAGGNPTYTEYEGIGHDSWSRTYSDVNTLRWLFQQRGAR